MYLFLLSAHQESETDVKELQMSLFKVFIQILMIISQYSSTLMKRYKAI